MSIPLTFSEVTVRVPNVAQDVDRSRQECNNVAKTLLQASNRMGGVAATYAALSEAIDAALVETPDSAAWKAEKERLALMLDNAAPVKAMADAGLACFAAVEKYGAAAVLAKIAELG
jgi:hypothetical protein